MKLRNLSGILFIFALLAGLVACEEDNSSIGSAISRGEVEITIDTIDYNLYGVAKAIENFDSKTGNLMIGNIQVDKYGKLDCSFVTRLMCASTLDVADSLLNPSRVDSCKLILGAERKGIIGDSLAPQVLTVYKLTKQLPSDINSDFDPQDFFDPSEPFASRSYTLSEIASKDSIFYNNTYIDISLDLPKEFGQEIFETYKNHPEVFQWPQTMARDFLPGLYVKSTFGNGSIANITSVFIAVFYHSLKDETTIDDNDNSVTTQVHVNHMAVPFTVSPEVLSSNNISYTPSKNVINKNEMEDGEVVITTPGGYIGEFTFPAEDLIDRFRSKNVHLSTINELILYLPAEKFDEGSDIGIAQNLLMVKSNEYESFFRENKTPDTLNSFTGVYDSEKGYYYFSSLRNYFISLLDKDKITQDDVTFTLVPVEITTETPPTYYSDPVTYVTKCVPYISKPSMTLVKTDQATVTFSFSTQIID